MYNKTIYTTRYDYIVVTLSKQQIKTTKILLDKSEL